MNFSDVIKALNSASAFELFRMQAAISRVLDEPRWAPVIVLRTAKICALIHHLAGALLRCKLLVWNGHTAKFAPCIASRETRLNPQIVAAQGIFAQYR